MTKSQLKLEEMVERLQPVLAPAGFRYESRGHGSSSGGPYATGFFILRSSFRIGLVARGDHPGMPTYEWGPTVRGHEDVMRILGREKDALLQWDRREMRATTEWTLFRKNRMDVVEALVSDLRDIILPALERGEIGRPPALPRSRLPLWMTREDDTPADR